MNDERAESAAAAPVHAPPRPPAAAAAWTPHPPPPPRPPGGGGGLRSRRGRGAAAIAGVLIAGVVVGGAVGLLTRGGQPAAPSRTAHGSSAPPAAVRARAIYSQALAAMRRSAGFHYVARSSGGGSTQTIVGDAGQNHGRQVITVDAAAGREQFTLVLVSGTVYFEGNVPALEDQLGVPAAGAPGLDGKWVSVSSQDGPFSVVAPGIVVADQAQETALVPTSTTSITVAGGAGATRIAGSVPPQQGGPAGTGHLDVAAGSHLPISYATTVSGGGATATSTTTFSGWGTVAAATAPAGAVAWSTLGATAPPGGYGSGGAGVAPSPTPQS